MSNQSIFICPVCKTGLGFKNVSKVAPDRTLQCPHCNATIAPTKSIHGFWGSLLGAISVIVPANIYLEYFSGNILIAWTIGAVCGAIVVIAIWVYIYKTTIFTAK